MNVSGTPEAITETPNASAAIEPTTAPAAANQRPIVLRPPSSAAPPAQEVSGDHNDKVSQHSFWIIGLGFTFAATDQAQKESPAGCQLVPAGILTR